MEYDSAPDVAPDNTPDDVKFRNLCIMLRGTPEPEIRARLIEDINALRNKLNGFEPRQDAGDSEWLDARRHIDCGTF